MSNKLEQYVLERLEHVKELAAELSETTLSDEDTQSIGQDITILINDIMLEMKG